MPTVERGLVNSSDAKHSIVAHFIQVMGILVLRSWLRFGFRGRILRARSVPSAPVLFASNHRSYADPPMIGMCARDPLSYFARADLWQIGFFRWILTVMHGIPIDRDNPGASSMKGAIANLRAGISVLVFPEGTRTKTGRVGPLRDGPALFARRAGVPVVPVYLRHSERVWPRGAFMPRLCGGLVEVRIGRPLQPPAGLDTRAQDAWIMRRLHFWMMANEKRVMGPRARS